jgi:hypothetical protein
MATMVDRVDSPDFPSALDVFKKGISHHVEEEEKDLFPQLRQKAGDQVAGLGDAHEVEEDVKQELGNEV